MAANTKPGRTSRLSDVMPATSRFPDPAGAVASAPMSPTATERQDSLANADFVTGFDVNLRDHTAVGSRDGGNGFFIFEFKDGLPFRNSISFIHEDANYHARIRALTEFWQFQIHKQFLKIKRVAVGSFPDQRPTP